MLALPVKYAVLTVPTTPIAVQMDGALSIVSFSTLLNTSLKVITQPLDRFEVLLLVLCFVLITERRQVPRHRVGHCISSAHLVSAGIARDRMLTRLTL